MVSTSTGGFSGVIQSTAGCENTYCTENPEYSQSRPIAAILEGQRHRVAGTTLPTKPGLWQGTDKSKQTETCWRIADPQS